MDTGSVSFFDNKLRKYVKNVEKDKEILKPILKSQREEHPNLE
jgi:hypothetical protein